MTRQNISGLTFGGDDGRGLIVHVDGTTIKINESNQLQSLITGGLGSGAFIANIIPGGFVLPGKSQPPGTPGWEGTAAMDPIGAVASGGIAHIGPDDTPILIDKDGLYYCSASVEISTPNYLPVGFGPKYPSTPHMWMTEGGIYSGGFTAHQWVGESAALSPWWATGYTSMWMTAAGIVPLKAGNWVSVYSLTGQENTADGVHWQQPNWGSGQVALHRIGELGYYPP